MTAVCCSVPECFQDVALHIDTDAILCEFHFAYMYRAYAGHLERDRPARRSPLTRADHPLVYYISTRQGTIKIGTSRCLARRMNSMYAPADALLAVEPGGVQVERGRHNQFQHLRLGLAEVFLDEPELRSFIEMVVREHGQPWPAAERIQQTRRSEARVGA